MKQGRGVYKTPNNTYRVEIWDEDELKKLGTFKSETEAMEVVKKFKEDRLRKSVKQYGHLVKDGVVIKDYYIIFDNGDIFSINMGRKLKPTVGKGYLRIKLDEEMFALHRLVAEAFVPNPENKPQVNHIDGDKLNNNYWNLEWCTAEENVRHAHETGLCPEGENVHTSKLTREDVAYIRTNYKPRDPIFNQNSLAKKFNVTQGTIRAILRNETWKNNSEPKKKKQPFLYPHQKEAVGKMFTGCIVNGSTGSGKSRVGIYWYFQKYGGSIDDDYNYTPMRHNPKPPDLYIISTSKKRDDKEFEGELAPFLLSTDPKQNMFYGNKIVIDSWQNIKKYADITGAFFIFDEDKVTGKGVWAKSFLKIAKNNEWIILSASPGDTWSDYETVFIANGFFKNRTEMSREHYVYARYSKFPKVERYINEQRLYRLRDKILIEMEFDRHTTQHHEDVYVQYDIQKYKDVIRTRWNPYTNEPIEQPSTLCYVLRRIVNEDESRQSALLELLEDHPKAIIFYNFDNELDILLNLAYQEGTEVAQYNGHLHQPVPKSDRWVYLVNYNACEAWNNTTTNCMIFFSQNYSYKIMLQAAGRIDRMNTKFCDLYYYHLRSRSGIDLAIHKALKQKKKFNERKFTKWE